MKFAKTIGLISYLIPLVIYAAPKPDVSASIAALDASVQSLNTATNTLNSTSATLNSSTLTLNQTMQLIGVDVLTLDTSVKSLSTISSTLNTTNTTLNSSTLSLNQTNGSLNISVQSLDQKINSLQGSVDALKTSIDSLAANAGGSGNGGGSSGGNAGTPSVEDLVYITNCTINSPIFVTTPSFNYRCFNGVMSLNKVNSYAPKSDVIFEVPADKTFVLTGFNMLIFSTSTPYANPNLILLEKNISNISTRKKQLSYTNSSGNQIALSYSQAQGGIIFSPGSKIVIGLDNNSSVSNDTIPFQFEMNGYLAN
jgi:prefoldin subunit 5